MLTPSLATFGEVRRWLADFIIAEVDPARVLGVTAEVIGRFMGASRVCFGEINIAAERCFFVLDWTCGVPSIQGPQPFYAESEFGRLYATGRTAVIDDYSELKLVRNEGEMLDESGGRYFIAVPLLRAGEVAAVFAVSDHRPRRWSDDEVALMTDIGPMIWRAYEHLLALERLAEAERVLASLNAPEPAAIAEPSGTISTFWLQASGGQVGLSIDQVDWIEAARDYAVLHTPLGNHVVRHTMASLERGLDPALMLRVHRSAFVSVAAVRAVERIGRRTLLILRGGTSVAVSASYVDRVRARLGAVISGRRVQPQANQVSAERPPHHIRGRSVPRPSMRQARSPRPSST